MNPPSGQIITAPTSLLKHVKYDHAWQITRTRCEGLSWKPELAPSPALFAQYLRDWKHSSEKRWWSEYERRFLEELETPEKKEALRELWRLAQKGLTVVLSCFCVDLAFCHRSLAGLYLKNKGLTVSEFDANSINQGYPSQLSLFN